MTRRTRERKEEFRIKRMLADMTCRQKKRKFKNDKILKMEKTLQKITDVYKRQMSQLPGFVYYTYTFTKIQRREEIKRLSVPEENRNSHQYRNRCRNRDGHRYGNGNVKCSWPSLKMENNGYCWNISSALFDVVELFHANPLLVKF